MEFKKAYVLMKEGYKLKRPLWEGYWAWDSFHKTIIMHCKNGVTINLEDINDIEYIITNVSNTDWEIVAEDNCKLSVQNCLSFNEAIELLSKNKIVARKSKPSAIFFMGEEGIIKEEKLNTKHRTTILTYDTVFGLDDIKANDWYKVCTHYESKE